MFGGKGKMSRKAMQANMKAMLAKTKVADAVMSGGGPGASAYQPKQNFAPSKAKPSSSSKSTR